MILPRTRIDPVNEWLGRAETALLPYLITNPPPGWDQTPTGLVPGSAPPTDYLFPFKFSRGVDGSTNGIYIRYGTVLTPEGGTVVPILSGSALSSTNTDNFLATWSDPLTTDTGKIYFDCLLDDSDEWTFTLTSVTIGWDADGTLPSDTGTGTATCHRYLAIGTDSPSGLYNYYYSNLGLVRFGQAAATYYLFAT